MTPRGFREAALVAASLVVATPGGAAAQQDSIVAVLARVRDEAINRSQVLETALGLSDLNGPRLSGSAGYMRAAAWARDQLTSWGLAHAGLEAWGRRGPSWELDRFSIEMTAPTYLRVNAMPRAWTLPTNGVVAGTPVLVSIHADSDYARYRGTLNGAIVLNGVPGTINRTGPSIHRFADVELDSMVRLIEPGEPHGYWEDYDDFAHSLEARNKLYAFFKTEGVAAVLEASQTPGVLRPDGFWRYAPQIDSAVPTLVLAREHYSRILRLVQRHVPVQLELSLAARFTQADSLGYDVVAELPGSDPTVAPEVVMIGGHLDSWIGGTGATDNAAGSAVAMEVLRILKAVNARPRRTIRIGLWDGEEPTADYSGSVGYVKHHYGDPETMKLRSEHARFDVYFNLDNGSGKIRGMYLQNDSAARPIFARMLAPLTDLGATTLTIANTGSTDHISFVGVGLPAFEFIQDPVDYETRTHHSVLDVGDMLLEDDLKQAAVVMASVVYQTAMLDQRIPRPPSPAARGH
jgi:carboxypeptidase Q